MVLGLCEELVEKLQYDWIIEFCLFELAESFERRY